jgi:hypothetical protein
LPFECFKILPDGNLSSLKSMMVSDILFSISILTNVPPENKPLSSARV